MLLDPKSVALVDNFAGQWLELRNLDSVKPDPDRFPNFDESLREAMKQETRMFFEAVIHEDRSILDFIDGKFTYLNERLAKHYGFQKSPAPSSTRRTHRQRALRYPDASERADRLLVSPRTSPVLRGEWVLENFLNDPPPPPPPGVGISKTPPSAQLFLCASNSSSIAPTLPAPPATIAWTPWASAWRITMP